MAAVKKFLRQLSSPFTSPGKLASTDDIRSSNGRTEPEPDQQPEQAHYHADVASCQAASSSRGRRNNLGRVMTGQSKKPLTRRSKSLDPARARSAASKAAAEEDSPEAQAPHMAKDVPQASSNRALAPGFPRSASAIFSGSSSFSRSSGPRNLGLQNLRSQSRLPRSQSAKTAAEGRTGRGQQGGLAGEPSAPPLLHVHGLGNPWQRSISLGAQTKRRVSDLTFVIDVMQEDRWVLTHTATGVDAKRPADHFFDVLAGLPLVHGIAHDFLPCARPKVPTEFFVPDAWKQTLCMSCVISWKAGEKAGFSPGGSKNLMRWGRGGSVGREQDLLRGPLPQGQQPEQQQGFSPGVSGPTSDLSTMPDRAWFVPPRGSSFPASYCIQFRSVLICPGAPVTSAKPVDLDQELVVTLELRKASDNGRSGVFGTLGVGFSSSSSSRSGRSGELWHAVRISVQVVKMGEVVSGTSAVDGGPEELPAGTGSRLGRIKSVRGSKNAGVNSNNNRGIVRSSSARHGTQSGQSRSAAATASSRQNEWGSSRDLTTTGGASRAGEQQLGNVREDESSPAGLQTLGKMSRAFSTGSTSRILP